MEWRHRPKGTSVESIETIVTAGGTAGLIAALLYAVFQFSQGRWHSHAEMEACEKRVAAADARTESALVSGTKATEAVEALTGELAAYRGMVERLLAERGTTQ